MNKILILVCMVLLLAVPASAMDFTAPEAPENVQKIMPDNTENFGDGLRYIIESALDTIQPSICEAIRVCVSLLAVSILSGLLSEVACKTKAAIQLAGTAATALILFQPTKALISLGTDTIEQISHYGKLLLPVMTGALAAQGGVTKSGALYAATAFFDALVSTSIAELLIPIVYVFLVTSVACNLFLETFLQDIKNFLKWLLTWGLKIALYVFTGYISITGVVGGTTDATVLKATKLTISGAVPVVGNILSDASEAVLVSAGVMKSAAGIYGLLTIIALVIGPFLRIGVQYTLLRITSGLCKSLGSKGMAGLVNDFSSAMGLLLAMTGTVSIIFVISTICFMQGVSV